MASRPFWLREWHIWRIQAKLRVIVPKLQLIVEIISGVVAAL